MAFEQPDGPIVSDNTQSNGSDALVSDAYSGGSNVKTDSSAKGSKDLRDVFGNVVLKTLELVTPELVDSKQNADTNENLPQKNILLDSEGRAKNVANPLPGENWTVEYGDWFDKTRVTKI